MLKMIFDPEGSLQSLRERLERAKEGVSDKVVGPIRQAFVEAIYHITSRVEAETIPLTIMVKGKRQTLRSKVTSNTTESVTDEEITLEVNLTARGIATGEYGDSRNRPTGVVRQEALGLQINAEQVLKDILKEA